MGEDLLSYYERELSFIRKMSVEFGARYPGQAKRLRLGPDDCEDPHVERILEGFALLAARVHHRLDDDFPEITQALVNILYPHYMRPIPSMGVVEFQLDPEQAEVGSPAFIPKGSTLFSKPYAGVPCKFRTCYDVPLWPIAVESAAWVKPEPSNNYLHQDAIGALQLRLRSKVNLRSLLDSKLPRQFNALRFFLSGENKLVHTLYELLCCSCLRILVGNEHSSIYHQLGVELLRPMGFEAEDDVLPYPRRSFAGYRLIQEYFSFPEKFYFFELQLDILREMAEAGPFRDIDILFVIAPFERSDRRRILEQDISSKTFRLGCTPIINLFPAIAEPILVDETRFEYPVTIRSPRLGSSDIFSIEGVTLVDEESREEIEVAPFHSLSQSPIIQPKRAFWYSTRRTIEESPQTPADMFLTLVDFTGRPKRLEADTLSVRCICTNADVPSRLPFGDHEAGDFDAEGIPNVKKIVMLTGLTEPIQPPLGTAALRRLISILSLNYLSLVEDGTEALQAIFRVHDFSGSLRLEDQIQSIVDVRSKRHFAQVCQPSATPPPSGIVFARGTRIDIKFAEKEFETGGTFLFAAILERFLGMYVSLNSFTQLVAHSTLRQQPLKEWRPRAGRKILV